MGEVAILFHPERWLTAWRAAGGFVTIGEGPFGEDGQRTVGLLDLAPTFPLSEPCDSAWRREQLARSEALLMVIDYLVRQRATIGLLGGGPWLPVA